MQNNTSCCGNKRYLSWGLLALRIAVGVIFIMHGYGKLFGDAPGMTAFTGMVAGLGFIAPSFFAYAAALAEFVGGIAVLLGIGTRYFAGLIACVMFVALFMVKKLKFPAADVDLSLFATTICLALVGGGRFTLMRYFKKNEMNGSGNCGCGCANGTCTCQKTA